MYPSQHILLLISLFIVLSPGFLLNIPHISASDALDQGISYENSGPHLCSSATAWLDLTKPECKKAEGVFTSGYTSHTDVLLHSVLFSIVLAFLPEMLKMRKLSMKWNICFTVLFLLLSPGFLLTLPALNITDCGAGHKNIAAPDANNSSTLTFCDAMTGAFTKNDACDKCNNIWMSGMTGPAAVLVHSIVFGTACYAFGTYWL